MTNRGGIGPEGHGLGGRLPLLHPSDLHEAQHRLYDYLVASKIPWAKATGFQGSQCDGTLVGPFNVFLYDPEMGRAFNDWVDAESAHSSLADDVRQIVILAVGGAWDAVYEIYAHSAAGRKAGLSSQVMDAVVAGSGPDDLRPECSVAFRFTRALVTDRAVSDSLYTEAVQVLGVKGVVDMVQLIGIYLATAALLNAFRIPAPSATERLP